jgi:hypothetical protein
VKFFGEYTGAYLGKVGQLFDEILRPDAGGERIGPEVFDIARADSGGLDRSRGSGPGAPLPLLVLELRDFCQSKYDLEERPGMYGMIDYPMMKALTGLEMTLEPFTEWLMVSDLVWAHRSFLPPNRASADIYRQAGDAADRPAQVVAQFGSR